MHTNSGSATDYRPDLFYLDLGENLTGRVEIEFSVKNDPQCGNLGFGIGLGSDARDPGNSPYYGSKT